MPPERFRSKEESSSEKIEGIVKDVGFSEAIGPRPTMEDTHLIEREFFGRKDRQFFAVYDGHGSREGAEAAAQKLHYYLEEGLNKGLEVQQALKSAYELIDGNIEFLEEAQGRNFGTTAVTAFIEGRKLTVANVGDARAVLERGGKVLRLSEEHKVRTPKEEKRITEAGGKITAYRGRTYVEGQGNMLEVSRSLGDGSFRPFVTHEPVFYEVELNQECKKLILACDGLWDVMSDQEAVALIKNAPAAEAAAQLLKNEALRRNSKDNITVIVVNF